MCPDWESNQQPFGLKAGTQSTEPHQPRFYLHFLLVYLTLATASTYCTLNSSSNTIHITPRTVFNFTDWFPPERALGCRQNVWVVPASDDRVHPCTTSQSSYFRKLAVRRPVFAPWRCQSPLPKSYVLQDPEGIFLKCKCKCGHTDSLRLPALGEVVSLAAYPWWRPCSDYPDYGIWS